MIYVGSDLHGCNPADFQALLSQAGFGDDDFLFLLGDVIDRGDWGAEFLLWLTQQPNMANELIEQIDVLLAKIDDILSRDQELYQNSYVKDLSIEDREFLIHGNQKLEA